MKNLFFVFILTIQLMNAQQNNQLTVVEYNNIKLNGVLMHELSDTKGNPAKMNSLFNLSFNYEFSDEILNQAHFTNLNKGLYIYFEDDILFEYIISNNQSSLFIKGVQIRIGDNISLLGPLHMSGNNKIKFNLNGTGDLWTIKFNSTTKIIEEIKYTSLD